ncbi:MAG TPA: nucleotidyltransferase family protein [Gemmatimonadales bacterium]|nr:nucleotidyltransferase family protein [Gemmatimonadales bacterium]
MSLTAGESACYALVLAAGQGLRFGGEKLLAPLHGRPLIAHVGIAVAQAMASGFLAGGVAVVRPGDTRLGWHLDTAGLELVLNPDADKGLATSIRCGLDSLAAAGRTPLAGAALIILGDEPLLRDDAIEHLIYYWRQKRTSVRPRYAQQPDAPGHPVLLDRGLWHLANRLEGDRGLSTVLAAQPGSVATLDLPGTNPDVDTQDDLRALEGGGSA